MNTVLNMYLEKGTQDWLISTNTSWKFVRVGFFTRNLGGKMNSSSSGFKELLMARTSGSAMKDPMTIRINMLKTSPALEWFCFALFLCFIFIITYQPFLRYSEPACCKES